MSTPSKEEVLAHIDWEIERAEKTSARHGWNLATLAGLFWAVSAIGLDLAVQTGWTAFAACTAFLTLSLLVHGLFVFWAYATIDRGRQVRFIRLGNPGTVDGFTRALHLVWTIGLTLIAYRSIPWAAAVARHTASWYCVVATLFMLSSELAVRRRMVVYSGPGTTRVEAASALFLIGIGIVAMVAAVGPINSARLDGRVGALDWKIGAVGVTLVLLAILMSTHSVERRSEFLVGLRRQLVFGEINEEEALRLLRLTAIGMRLGEALETEARVLHFHLVAARRSDEAVTEGVLRLGIAVEAEDTVAEAAASADVTRQQQEQKRLWQVAKAAQLAFKSRASEICSTIPPDLLPGIKPDLDALSKQFTDAIDRSVAENSQTETSLGLVRDAIQQQKAKLGGHHADPQRPN